MIESLIHEINTASYDKMKILIKRYGSDIIFELIEEKSDNLLMLLINDNSEIFERIKNPTKAVIKMYIEKSSHIDNIKKYTHLFNQHEIVEMALKNPILITLLNYDLYHNIISNIIYDSPHNIKYIHQNNKSIKYFTLAIISWLKKRRYSPMGLFSVCPDINWGLYENNPEWNVLINTLVSAGEIIYVPVKYISEEALLDAIKTTQINILNKYLTKLFSLRDDINKQKIYDEIFKLNSLNTNYIPYEYQTYEMRNVL